MHFDERQATNPAAIEILEICDAGHYTSASGRRVSIAHAQQAAVGGTRYFSPEDGVAPAPGQPGSDGPRVEVIDATTQEASLQLADEGDVAALNFASARNPGGGFLGGARAQEEEVCRCSGLYRCLVTAPEYYTYHRAHRSLLYSDRMIYSPKVPFFRTAAKQPLLEEPFLVSVITAPAPNAGAIARNAPDDARHIAETLRRRWGRILDIAAHFGHGALVLGAWGCGAFRNDPTVVAEAARAAIAGAAAPPRHLVFAIPNRGKIGRANFAAFHAVFQDAAAPDASA